jgi:hypothetical protein
MPCNAEIRIAQFSLLDHFSDQTSRMRLFEKAAQIEPLLSALATLLAAQFEPK